MTKLEQRKTRKQLEEKRAIAMERYTLFTAYGDKADVERCWLAVVGINAEIAKLKKLIAT